MSESEKTEKKNGDIVVSGSVGIPAGNAPALPAKDGGKIRSMVNAGKKLAQTLGAFGDYAGGLTQDAIESGQIAARGYAVKKHSEGVAAFVDAYAKLSEQFGAEKAQELLGMTPESIALRRQAGTRMLQMEEQRQKNINAVARQAEQKLPEKVSEEPIKQEWVARYIESVQDVFDETMQDLWASILAGEVATPGQTSLRTLDVLKNLTQLDAQEFDRILQFSFGGNVYYPTGDQQVCNRILSYDRKIHMEECGLVYDAFELAADLGNSPSTRFVIGTFMFSAHPSPPRDTLGTLAVPAFSISSAGREIARFVPAKFPAPWYILALAKFLATKGACLRLKARLPQMMVNPAPLEVSPTTDVTISPEMSEDEVRVILEKCPRGKVGKQPHAHPPLA